MINILKGFIIGIGKIIPGVSGAVLAISMGVYDKSLFYINNFKNNKKESIKFLAPLGIGILVSLIFFSKIINYLLEKYYLITMLFFIGLVIGTVPSITKKINKKEYHLIIISFIIFIFPTLISNKSNYQMQTNSINILILLISGLLEAIGTIVPGVSSTALLMTIGTYKIIISAFANITNISHFLTNIRIIIPFSIGTIFSTMIVIKIINYLFRKHHNKVYSIILGLLLSTILIMIIETFKYRTSILNLIIGIVLMSAGIFISGMFEK